VFGVADPERSPKMKSYALGFLSTLLLVGIAFGVVSYRKQQSPALAYRITTKEDRLGRQGAFEVHRDDIHLFTYTVEGNGFSLYVPSDSVGLPRLFFSQSDQNKRGISYELSIRPTLKSGMVEHVAYDMSTGEISRRILSTGGKLTVDERRTEGEQATTGNAGESSPPSTEPEARRP
jgi:hypothetical protein